MKKLKVFLQNNIWEIVGYLCLALCVVGQITVGYIYLPAQIMYLVSNALAVYRNYALNLPRANKVKDICFTAITIGLILIYIFK